MDALVIPHYTSDAVVREQMDAEIPSFESRSATLEQQLKKNGMLSTPFSDNSFKTFIRLTRIRTASQTPVDDSMKNNFNANN